MKTVAQRSTFGAPCASMRVAPRLRVHASTQTPKQPLPDVGNVTGGVALGVSLLASHPALAAQEVATLAAADNRLGAVAFLFVPAIAWVLFNISGPANRQLAGMRAGKPKPATPKSATRRAAPKKAKAVAKRRR